MHELRNAREITRVEEMVEDLINNPHLTPHMLHGLRKRLGSFESCQAYGLRTMNACSKEGREMGHIIGETAKMVYHAPLSELVLPKRLTEDKI